MTAYSDLIDTLESVARKNYLAALKAERARVKWQKESGLVRVPMLVPMTVPVETVEAYMALEVPSLDHAYKAWLNWQSTIANGRFEIEHAWGAWEVESLT